MVLLPYYIFNKSSGNFQFSLQQNIESDTYDINDLGYLQNNNEQKRSAKLKYFIFNPIGKLRKAHFEISYTNSKLYNPNLFNSNIAEAKIRLHSTNFLKWCFN